MATSLTSTRPATGQVPVPAIANYRPEIEGLRAVAVFLVVIYHIWLGRISGGVDIFLLISTFLMTLQFGRMFESGRSFNLLRRYVHTFKRLLPAAVIVLLATLIGTYFFVPASRWQDIVDQTWSSLFYFENWTLAINSVDYYAQDHSQASPLQHFWSLSVQGQVFILWPIIFGLLFLIARKRRQLYKPLAFTIFGLIFAASLIFSIFETYTNQQFAYFDTRTRLWEFALGSLIALLMPYLNLPRRLRIVMGWVGMMAIVLCGIVLDVGTQFPGYVALWPLAAAAFVILAGQTQSTAGVDYILSSKVWAYLGRSSYSLYLWHWPILVIYLTYFDLERVDFLTGLGIIVVSLILALATTYLIERPIRSAKGIDASTWRSLGVIGACVALVAGPAIYGQISINQRISQVQAQGVGDNPGARVLSENWIGDINPNALIKPAAEELPNQFASLEGSCTGEFAPSDPLLQERCAQTAPYGPDAPVILFIGDSHAEQWMPAFQTVAEQNQANQVALLLGACPFSEPDARNSQQCADFNQKASEYAKNLSPDLVVTVATEASPSSPDERMVSGWDEAVIELADSGIPVLGLRDNPRYDFNIAECALTSNDPTQDCALPVSEVLAPEPPYQAALDAGYYPGLVSFLDMTDLLCPNGLCQPVIGNMMVYLDDNHVTKDYSASMADQLARRFADLDLL